MTSTVFLSRQLIGKVQLSFRRCSFSRHRNLVTRVGVQGSVVSPSEKKTRPSYEEVERELGPFSSKPYIPDSSGLMVVISGPSGVGKDVVIQEMQRLPVKHMKERDLHFVVTATTRQRREKEVDGRDYHFVTRDVFEKWIKEDELYEYSVVYGDYKGVPKEEIRKASGKGLDCILRVDVNGARTIKRLIPNCITIFLSPHSQEEQVRRLVSRQTESIEDLRPRILTADKEMALLKETVFDYVVENRDGEISTTVSKILGILNTERMSRSRLFQNNGNY